MSAFTTTHLRKARIIRAILVAALVASTWAGCSKHSTTTGVPKATDSRATDDQLATKVTLTQPYPLSYAGAESNRITVQYAVSALAKQAKLGYDFGASQANAGEVCRKYITPEVEGIPLREAFAKLLDPEALTYDLRDGKIVLKKN